MKELNLKNAVEPDAQPDSFWHSPGLWMISGLLVIAALANFVGTWFFFEIGVSDLTLLALCSAFGLLIAEVSLIAIWLAFGSQPLLWRICLSLGSLFTLTCLYVLGLFNLDGHTPAEIPLVTLGIAFAFVGMMCFPLGLVRWKAKRAISRKVVELDVEASQFGIRHLLTVTAVAAVLIVLGQNTFPQEDFRGGTPWLMITYFIAIYMLLSCLICLLSVATVFDQRRRWLNSVLLVGTVLIGAAIAAFILWSSFSEFSYDLSGNIFNSIAYSASLAITLVTVLTAFLVAGYKFQKS